MFITYTFSALACFPAGCTNALGMIAAWGSAAGTLMNMLERWMPLYVYGIISEFLKLFSQCGELLLWLFYVFFRIWRGNECSSNGVFNSRMYCIMMVFTKWGQISLRLHICIQLQKFIHPPLCDLLDLVRRVLAQNQDRHTPRLFRHSRQMRLSTSMISSHTLKFIGHQPILQRACAHIVSSCTTTHGAASPDDCHNFIGNRKVIYLSRTSHQPCHRQPWALDRAAVQTPYYAIKPATSAVFSTAP